MELRKRLTTLITCEGLMWLFAEVREHLTTLITCEGLICGYLRGGEGVYIYIIIITEKLIIIFLSPSGANGHLTLMPSRHRQAQGQRRGTGREWTIEMGKRTAVHSFSGALRQPVQGQRCRDYPGTTCGKL